MGLLLSSSRQLKNMSVPFMLVDPKSGVLVWQNAASMEAIGCHGLDNSQPAPGAMEVAAVEKQGFNFLSMLFHGEEGSLEEMRSVVATGNHFKRRIEVTR